MQSLFTNTIGLTILCVTSLAALIIIIRFLKDRNVKFKDLEIQGAGVQEVPGMRQPRTIFFFEHIYFVSMLDYLKFDIRNLVISSPVKERVVKIFLTIKFAIFYYGMHEFVARYIKDQSVLTTQNYKKLIFTFIDLTYQYAEGNNVPGIFLEKFRSFYEPNLDTMLQLSKTLLDSTWYSSPDFKMQRLLDLLLYSFTDTILTCERTMESFNGELDREIAHSQLQTDDDVYKALDGVLYATRKNILHYIEKIYKLK